MSASMISVGVDPGLDGAIVAVDLADNKIVFKTIMPVISGKRREYDIAEINRIFRVLEETHQDFIVNLEKAGKFSRGVLAVASTNFCSGIFQGILTSMQIPYRLVRAIDWQRQVLKGLSGDTKQASILWATRMYPDVDLRRSARANKVHDGLCDALGLAHYRV